MGNRATRSCPLKQSSALESDTVRSGNAWIVSIIFLRASSSGIIINHFNSQSSFGQLLIVMTNPVATSLWDVRTAHSAVATSLRQHTKGGRCWQRAILRDILAADFW